MFHVITCKKYTRQTIRIVNVDDIDSAMDGDMGECLLCGPCSHVELGRRKDYWTVHSSHVTELEATSAAWSKVDEAGLDSGRCDMSYLPAKHYSAPVKCETGSHGFPKHCEVRDNGPVDGPYRQFS